MTDGVTLNPFSGGPQSAHDLIDNKFVTRTKWQHGADGYATDVSNASPLPVWFCADIQAALGELKRQSRRFVNGVVSMPANTNWILIRPDAVTLTFTDEGEALKFSHSGTDAVGESGARKLYAEGLDSNFDPITETIPLRPGGSTTSAKLYRRLNSLYVSEAGQNGKNSAAISLTNTGLDLRQNIAARENNHRSTLFTVPTGKKAIITGLRVMVRGTTQNETQIVSLPDDTSGGTFTITVPFVSGTTGNIAYNATAAAFKTALVSGTSLTSGDLDVTGGSGFPWVVTFKGSYANTNLTAMTGDGTNLVGAATITFTNTSGICALDGTKYECTWAGTMIIDGAQGGTFTLTQDGNTTSSITYGATGATVQSALEALSSVTAAGVSKTSDDEYFISLTTLQDSDDPALTATSSLTGGDVTVTTSEDGGLPVVSARLVSKGLTTPKRTHDHLQNVSGVVDRKYGGGIVIPDKTDIWVEAKNGTVVSGSDVESSYELTLVDINNG